MHRKDESPHDASRSSEREWNPFASRPKYTIRPKSMSTSNAKPPATNSERPDITVGLTPFSFDMYLSGDKKEAPNSSLTSSDEFQPPWIHVPPRSNWAVQDNKLKTRPSLFPPMNPYTCTYIGDSSPSVIAVRIAECFRKNNVIVEYDDEAATATAYTSDKVLLSLYLYRGGKGSVDSNHRGVDLSHGVLIECIRVQGDTIPFHRLCYSIFSSARGVSDGLDKERHKHACFQDSSLGRCPISESSDVADIPPCKGFSTAPTHPRFYIFQPKFIHTNKLDVSQLVSTTLSKASSLLEKDRYDAQTLGLQLLIHVTDTFCSRIPVAVYSSFCILGVPMNDRSSKTQVDPYNFYRIHDYLFSTVTRQDAHGSLSLSSKLEKSNIAEDDASSERTVSLRSLALRVLINALSVLVTQGSAVHSIISSPAKQTTRLESFWSDSVLEIFIQDIRGAGRPPHTYLGNSNEAALTIRFLRFLVTYSMAAKQHLMSCEDIQNVLDRAFVIGMSQHKLLEDESTKLLQILLASH